MLALVYNDLKGLIFFKKEVVENYRISNDPNELNSHVGNVGGIVVQIDRLIISHIYEFFLFLKEHKKVLSSSEFAGILEKTNSDIVRRWNEIKGVALGESMEVSDFSKKLSKIRNNVTFHYYQSGKVLRKSFLDVFVRRQKVKRNEKAFYSLGESMEDTRFYYADAAVEEYIRSMVTEDIGAIPTSVEGYSPELVGLIRDINFTIIRLMKSYLKNRPS